MFEDEEGMQAHIKLDMLISKNTYPDYDVEGNKYVMYIEDYQTLHDEQYLNDVEKRAKEEIEQQKEIEIYANQNDEENNFLTNKDIMEEDQIIRSHDRIGMDQLANIVLNMQRDFKRVANALSVQGAQEIVDKHNENSPNAPWTVHNDDVNNDGIPDIIIRNANNNPIIVNGWTTKGSDYPARYKYYEANPTKEQRKANPYPKYKRDDLYQIQYDMTNPDVHRRGNVLRYNQQAFPENWNVDKYNVNKNPGKRLSAYQRFQQLIIKHCMNVVIPVFIERGAITLNESGKWKDKMKCVAKASAALWELLIIQTVGRRRNLHTDSKQFRKFKNSVQGKQFIDNLVTELYYHLTQTNPRVDWTEEKRANLQNNVLNMFADELMKAIQHTAQLADDQHIYPDYHAENVTEFNTETEGEFGNDW